MIIELHEALVNRLASAVPGLLVSAYPCLSSQVSLPMAALELTAMQQNTTQPGDGRTAIDCDFSLILIAAPEQSDAELGLRALSAQLMHILNRSFRPLPGHAGHVRAVQADEGDFKPELDGYIVWTLRFSIEVYEGVAIEP